MRGYYINMNDPINKEIYKMKLVGVPHKEICKRLNISNGFLSYRLTAMRNLGILKSRSK